MNIHFKSGWVCAILVLGLCALAGLTGCKVDSADARVRISPDSAVLNKHESVTLTAHDGYRYAWSLEREEWGVLNTRSGSEVVYTSLYEPGTDVPAVQVVVVVSTFDDSQPEPHTDMQGTVKTSYVSRAEAYITHLAGESPQTFE